MENTFLLAQSEKDHYWMDRALGLAKRAAALGEVPVGAVLVTGIKLIAEGWNQCITECDPTAHAEMVALRQAGNRLRNYRLVDLTLYVTLEPCMMCAGAMIHARIERLVFGAFDPRTGSVCSVCRLLDEPFINHRISYEGGVRANESSGLLQDFFRERR